jgi:hypothetical protein
VVFADWLCTTGAKESEKGGGGVGCEEMKIEADAEYRRTEEVGHDSSKWRWKSCCCTGKGWKNETT